MFGSGSNIEGVDRARAVLAEGELAVLAADPDREVDAVKALRGQVRSLSLVDAVRLVREVRSRT